MKNICGNLLFENRPSILSYASAVGKKEGEGPLGNHFDKIIRDSYVGKDTFEQAESELTATAVRLALKKAGMTPEHIGAAFCGDLLNQCVASSFAMRSSGIPYVGIYGACSTMALGLILSAIAVECGAEQSALCAASSHYCTAERQYRFPLEYGSQRPPTAQWTVTGAGACVIGKQKPVTTPPDNKQKTADPTADKMNMPYISAARIGMITDYGVTDQNNMGAAMAPAVVKLGTKINSS